MLIIIFIFDALYLEVHFSFDWWSYAGIMTDKQKEKMTERVCDKYESDPL